MSKSSVLCPPPPECRGWKGSGIAGDTSIQKNSRADREEHVLIYLLTRDSTRD